MAWSERQTIIANPARRKGKRNVARRMSLKQKLHFGTKAQRSAARRAIKAKRKGYGIELSHGYYLDALLYARAEEQKASIPSLFDLWEEENGEPIDVPAEVLG